MPIITIFYISLAFLLLYDCSAYSHSQGSYNSYYSNYFNSGLFGFNSNAFNYKSFVSLNTRSFVNSNTLVSSKSVDNFGPYLSLINSYSYIQSQSKKYSFNL